MFENFVFAEHIEQIFDNIHYMHCSTTGLDRFPKVTHNLQPHESITVNRQEANR